MKDSLLKYAILGDIHANLEAFEAVLEDARQEQCTHFVCVGDIVGYNSNPQECLQIVRDLGIQSVKGNHDEYSSTEVNLRGLSSRAATAVAWARQQLSEGDKQWLRNLKHVRLIASFSIVHATLDSPQNWGYVLEKFSAAASFSYQNTALCFFGHTHIPVVYIRDSFVRGGSYSRFIIEPGRKYLVNVGSVGEPRDGDPRAAYVVYNPWEASIELRRVPYDYPKTQAKLREAGLAPRRELSLR